MARLDIIFTLVVLDILAIASSVDVYEVSGVDKELLAELIKTKKLKEDGYSDFELSMFHEIDYDTGKSSRASSESIRRRRRSYTESADGPYIGPGRRPAMNLTFTAFHRDFRLTVEPNTRLLGPGTRVTTVKSGGRRVEYTGQMPDCYLGGWTEGHGVVSLSYCDGISGSVAEGETLYRIDPVGELGEHFTETVLVSKTKLTPMGNDVINITNNIVTQQNKQRGGGDEPTGGRDGEDSRRRRTRRQTYPDVVVEVGVYLDEIFFALLEAAGDTDEAMKIDKLALKWNMVQAMLAIPDELEYNIIIEVKDIVFWEANPSWFAFNKDSISSTMGSFCTGLYANDIPKLVDTVHLHTGTEDPGGAMGLAYNPGVCVTNRCSVASDISFYKGFITAHEFGHIFGSTHDTSSCPEQPCDGFMAVSNYPRYGWSTPSRDAFHNTITGVGADCLNIQNVASGSLLTLEGVWPGMLLSQDQVCEQYYGAGYQMRGWYTTINLCTQFTCVNTNPGIHYGTMEVENSHIFGQYCGEGMVCDRVELACKTFAETLVPLSKITVRTGGWSAWGGLAGSCSTTCGTGLLLKSRTCTNPSPLNTGPCAGSAHWGQTCDTGGCASEPSRKNRAAEVCQRLLVDGILSSSEFTNAGDRRSSSTSIGQCEVKCTTTNGHTYPATFRFAFMPDGAPCVSDTVTMTTPESKGYPRGRGIRALCMQGYCEMFGCDGISNSGMNNDLCGVCGGDGTTCVPYDMEYCTTQAAGTRVEVATIPAGAWDLQFYFGWTGMKEHYIELWDTAGTALLATFGTGTSNTGANPLSLAGADWHYTYFRQFLWSSGPTTADVIIKIYNKDGNTNNCIKIGFSLPIASTDPTFPADVVVDTTVTTAAPGTTTAAPATTTAAQGTTTTVAQGTTTTVAQGTTTVAQGTTTIAQGTTTVAQGTTTVAQGTTTPASGTTTVAPGTTTAPPATTTVAPTGSTESPCAGGMFYCQSTQMCFSYEDLCDNIRNCIGGEDEANTFCQSGDAAVTRALPVLLLFTLVPIIGVRAMLS